MAVKEYVFEDTFVPTLLQTFSSLTAFSLTFAVAKTFDLVVTTKNVWTKILIIWTYVILVFSGLIIVLTVYQETKETVEVRKQIRLSKIKEELEKENSQEEFE